MELPDLETTEQLLRMQAERLLVADTLQNDVGQILASVLLWIQYTKIENKLVENVSFAEAEKNLKVAIDKIRSIHYLLAD